MLSPDAPFPYVGSYALLIDSDLPKSAQRAELVRIMWRRLVPEAPGQPAHEEVSVSFPLRAGACGNKLVPFAELINPTPLDDAEKRELTDLQRHLAGRVNLSPKLKVKLARVHALRQRLIWSQVAKGLLERAVALQARKRAA